MSKSEERGEARAEESEEEAKQGLEGDPQEDLSRELDGEPPLQEQLPDLSESVDCARRAREGDRQALERLLERYQERLERIVRIELGAELGRFVEPGDIVQEVYLVVQRRIGDFELRSHSGFLAWLVTIAKRKIKDKRQEMNALKRDRGREVPLNLTGSSPDASSLHRPLAGSSSGPVTRAWKKEFRELMDRTLTELSEDYRRVILLRDYYGAEWDEIERELGRGKHACEQLHQRAWIRLKLEVMKKLHDRP